MKKCIIFIVSVVMCLSAIGCSPLTPDPQNRDLLAMLRAYQFLEVFSIYQDSLPIDPLDNKFKNPEEITIALHDTLKGFSYTNYWYPGSAPEELFGPRALYKEFQNVNAQATFLFAELTPLTGYIKLSSFDSSTLNSFMALPRIPQNLVIDLRQNGGGQIAACTSTVELFLPENRNYLRVDNRYFDDQTEKGATHNKVVWKSFRSGDRFEGKKVAILIDAYSASASEIMAVALRDAMDAADVHLFGARSYGKGIGQYLFTLRDNSSMQITGFHFFRYDSLSTDYHRHGIDPDVFTLDTVGIISLGKDTAAYVRAFNNQLTDGVYKAGVWLKDDYLNDISIPVLVALMGGKRVSLSKYVASAHVVIPTEKLPAF